MKDIFRYILFAFTAVLLEWVWLAFFPILMNGLSQETAMVAGVGFFLAFEVALCTGLVLSKLKK